jgi:flagellar hook-associated protein 1 FlgK
MSLIAALNIGKSALAVSQAAIQTTGNNIANAGNPNYTRQTARLEPTADRMLRPGVFLGTGINLSSIRRNIDEALEGRIRGSISDNSSADTLSQWLSRVESVFNELSDQDLSTQLSQFFASWSNLANKPQDIGLRQVVIQNGQSLASWLQNLRGQLGSLQSDVDDRLMAQTRDANALSQQIADLNAQIVTAEAGSGGTANGLRDQRDALLRELSELIDIQTSTQENGVINVYVGSEPLVLGAMNRGVSLRQETVDGKLTATVTFTASAGEMSVHAGQVGALDDVRAQIGDFIDQLDTLAGNLIFELNKLHSSGQGLEGVYEAAATNAVDDAAVALNSADAGLDFAPVNGSFVVHVRSRSSGLVSSTLVQVDLDGSGAETTLETLRAELDAIDDISAVISGGKLIVRTDAQDVDLSFSQDSSGVLAALGINSFFTGSNARDIDVSALVKATPALLAAAKNGQPGDNQTARAVAGLEASAMAGLGGNTLKSSYESLINQVAVAAAGTKTDAEATLLVRETLQAQREALSGVSLDEEAINLMRQQRAFQGASRLIAAVDELMDAILALV